MKLIMLPASSLQPQKHFDDTVKSMISKNHIQNYVTDNLILSKLPENNSLWGLKKTSKSIKNWEQIESGDIALFYANKEFFYQCTVGIKFESKDLALSIWDKDQKDDQTWELIFTLENGDYNPQYTWEYIKRAKGWNKPSTWLQRYRVLEYISPEEDLNVNKYFPDLEGTETISEEGKKRIVQHARIERNQSIVKRKKQLFKDLHGSLYCEACNFNFEKIYGTRGKDYIECHHLTPISDYKIQKETKMDDLALVCSNCHRMIHRTKDMLTINELKNMLPSK